MKTEIHEEDQISPTGDNFLAPVRQISISFILNWGQLIMRKFGIGLIALSNISCNDWYRI